MLATGIYRNLAIGNDAFAQCMKPGFSFVSKYGLGLTQIHCFTALEKVSLPCKRGAYEYMCVRFSARRGVHTRF